MQRTEISRRRFIKNTLALTTLAGTDGFNLLNKASAVAAEPKQNNKPAQTVFPRWRGFNLQYLFTEGMNSEPFEDDFRWAQDWGFDFFRLPMSYRLWTDKQDVFKIDEKPFARIDKVIEWGQKYNMHISLNFHRGPGFCISRADLEPFNLWKDQKALDTFCYHWEFFARRYKGIPSTRLSFDLINEPVTTLENYERVVRTTTKKIRTIDPQRLIIIDGLNVGRDPVPELIDLKVGQSCRGYDPVYVTHYRASWVDRESKFPTPVWPDTEKKTHQWDRQRLEDNYARWADLARQGVGVHCGECGCHNKTSHTVCLAWFRDLLEVLTGYNIGYALWNLRGPSGVLDSGRQDVQYEDFHDHKLDRKLLKVLQEF